VNGGRCFNDSIATTPEATIAALSAFESGVHLLLGGSDKGLSYVELANAIAAHRGIRGVYVQGTNAPAIQAAIGKRLKAPVQQFQTFDAACDAAFAAMQPGEVFLMSPASASFYEFAPNKRFTNFEHRGRHFKQLVEAHA
jgi:UDP-N-acetylmuramoylalanine--D-glutamate ligase